MAGVSAMAALSTSAAPMAAMLSLDAVTLVAFAIMLRMHRAKSTDAVERIDPPAMRAAWQDLAGAAPRPPSPLPESRKSTAHPVSGLPLREALLARMSADRTGMLGAIAFSDFERLTAFDPALGERVFAAATGRLRAMLPADRLPAQVDRGRVALWFPGATPEAARAELDAIGYALGQSIDVDGREVVPEVKLRLARFDAGDALEPRTFLARTLASFTLPDGAVDPASAPDDYARLARERYALEQELRQAIARRELRLVFQPLIDAGQGCVSGAEALIRWDHREFGSVPPSTFVPVVEAMGLASEFGLWALNSALREARDWAAQGLGHLRVAVNVSGLQLERDDLPVLVQRTLQRHELPATALEIELTESVATSDAEHCRCVFETLRAMGVKLAVDDFGTGYSGFASLRNLAFDKIKIDREFVTAIDTRRDSQAICQSMIALGRGLGIRVLAEGVERREEYDWLRRHGCQHFQGYHFSAPLTPEAFVAYARNTAGLAAALRPKGARDRIQELSIA